jgi:S-adenosylmethionine synthetase
MLSRIGKPVTSPALVQVKLAARERAPVDRFERQVADVVAECLSRIPKRIDDFVAGAVSIF